MGNANQPPSKPENEEEDICSDQMTVSEYIYRRADKYADKVALREHETDRTITFGELKRQVCAVSSALSKRGFGKGQYLTLFGGNCIENFPISHGAMATGGTVHLMKPGASKVELSHHIKMVQPRFFVTTSDCISLVDTAVKEYDCDIEEVFVIGECKMNYRSTKELLEDPGDRSTLGLVRVDAENDVAVLLQTGGTTGMSKTVMATHRVVIDNIKTYAAIPQKDQQLIFSFLPFNYVSGFLFTNTVWISNCSTIVILLSFDPDTWLEAIEKHKILWTVFTPAIAVALTQSSSFYTREISCLKFIFWMGAPVSKELERSIKEKFGSHSPGIMLFQGYGLTEAISGVTSMSFQDIGVPNKEGSCGRPLPGAELKVIDKSGNPLTANQPGEILVKTKTFMKGYFKNESLTQEVIKDGWYHTGDYGWFDEDGYFFVIDRIEEIIHSKQGMIIPSILESLIRQHEKVNECVVVGKGEEHEKLPYAFVVPKSDVEPEEILDYVKENAESPYYLEKVEFVSEIPKSPQGKLLRMKMV